MARGSTQLPDLTTRNKSIAIKDGKLVVSGSTAAIAISGSTGITNLGTTDTVSERIATEDYVGSKITSLVASAPTSLNTLDELAAALGDDASFSSTVNTALGNRLRVDTASQGLNSTQKSNARTNLGLGTAATSATGDFATAAQGTKADTAHGWGDHASAGYLTSESDTLASVTGRGATTSTAVTFNSTVSLGNAADLRFVDLAGTFPTTGKGFDWTLNNDGARIYAIQPSSDSIDLVFQLRDNATTNDRFVFHVDDYQGTAYDKYPLIIRGGTEFDLVSSALYTNGTVRLSNAGVLQNVTGNISMFTNNSGYLTSVNNDNWSGADLSLANGGTGASLSDPNADRILFWDDSAGAMTWLTAGSNLTISGTTISSTNTTYSVGDGGLTEKNFTTALLNKLNGIATSADNYGSWTISDGTSSEAIASGNTLTVRGDGASSVSYDAATNTLTISSTDTDTNTVTQVGVTGNLSSGNITLVGSGATSITKSGNTITISSTDTDTNTTYSAGTGITLTGTTFSVTTPTDNNFTTAYKSKLDGIAAGATANAGTVTSVATGTGLTGGTITSTGTISLSHLGFQNLTDPNADRIAFWDDSAGSFAWLTLGSNLSISGTTINATDTNTTYSVGDGGLTEKNFTTGLFNKLNGIATGADNYGSWTVSDGANTEAIGSGATLEFRGRGATTVSYDAVNNIVNIESTDTDTNTTYSVGDGGLTEKNFTTALKSKLDGIEAGATADQTAAEILTLLKTVDGAGSGLDADLLDGNSSAAFATAAQGTKADTAYGWGNHASAGYLTSVTNISGYAGNLVSEDNRAISPSELSANRFKFGFTSWGNNNTSPYADFIHLRSYQDASGGSDNLVMFKKSGIGMRIWQQSWGSSTAYSSYADVWTTDNFSQTNVNNWNTAYGWGNHASAGYITSLAGYATETYVNTAISNLVDTAPDALNTLNELAAALGDDANFSTTITTSIGTKLTKSSNLSDLTDASAARTNLGLGTLATLSSVNAATITDNSVGAAELNVTGNGTTSQYLRSDGDGTFTWATPPDTNTTYSAGTGITLTGTTFSVTTPTDNNFTTAYKNKLDGIAAGATANAGTVTSVATGTGLTGGTITSTGTISLSHLGFQNLTDPNADRIAFWDDSAGTFAWLSLGSNLSISGTTINATDTNTTYSAGSGLSLSGTTFSLASHTHAISEVTGLQSALDGKLGSSSNSVGVSITGHGNGNFSFYQTSGEFAGYSGWANYFIGNHGDGATYYNTTHIMPFWGAPQYSRLEGGVFKGPWTYWTTENFDPASKANASHTHAISDVTGLQSALDGKQAAGSYAAASHTHSNATTSAAGFMSTTDKSKLDGIASGANNYSLPTATASVLGGVKIGSRISISSGVISADVQTDNNFTTAYKNKLDGIADGANIYNSFTVADGAGAGQFPVRNEEKLSFKGSGATQVTFDPVSTQIIISSTDTDTNTTYSAGSGLSLSGTQFSHADTSTQSSVNNSGRTFIQDITLDTYGHVTAIVSATDADTYTGTVTSVATSGGLTGGTITSTGTISISSDARPNANQYFGNSGGEFIYFDNTNALMRFYMNSSERFRLYNDGTAHFDGDVIAYSSTISDVNLKDNIVTIGNALDKVKRLRGVEYDWNSGSRKGQHDIGVIAQEVEEVLPEIVREKEMPFIDGNVYKTVDYEKMVGVLIEAMKEQQVQIEALRAEVEILKNK